MCSLHFTRIVRNMDFLCVKCRLQFVHKRSKQTASTTPTITTTTTTMLIMKNATTRKQRRKLREILKLHTHDCDVWLNTWNHRLLEYYSRIISAYTHTFERNKKHNKWNNRKKLNAQKSNQMPIPGAVTSPLLSSSSFSLLSLLEKISNTRHNLVDSFERLKRYSTKLKT